MKLYYFYNIYIPAGRLLFFFALAGWMVNPFVSGIMNKRRVKPYMFAYNR